MTKVKVKFSKQNDDFINELREQVKDYFKSNNKSKYGNANLIIKSVFMFTLYLAPYFLMVLGIISSVPVMLICWAIMGAGMAGVGMVTMHDANHGSFSKNNRINKIVGRSIYLLGGYPPNWRYQHNTMHHGYTNIDGHDEDIKPADILRFSPHRPLKKIHKYQHLYAFFFYGLMTMTWSIDKDYRQLFGYKKAGIKLSGNRSYPRMITELIVAKIMYFSIFLVIPIIFVPFSFQ